MNPPRILLLLCSLLLILASTVVAAPSQHYALAYSWHRDVQQALNDRAKLARALSLSLDRQLQIVGQGRNYGVVYPLNNSLAQTHKLALTQSNRLKLAGFTPPEIVLQTAYKKLYHLQWAHSSNPNRLKSTYERILGKLPPQDRRKLQIEKTGPRSYGLVYHCWTDKAAANQLAKQHRKLFKITQSPGLIAALDRPGRQAMISVPTSKNGGSTAAMMSKTCKVAVGPRQGSNQATTIDTTQIARPETSGGSDALNGKVQNFLREQRSKGKLQRQERTALVAYDLTNNTYLASINSQRSFQAASMIKPFVALAFFHQVDNGKMRYTAKHRQMMEQMIQHSNNEATNWFIRQLGGPARCNALLNKEYGRLFRQVRIREYIPPGGKTYKNSALPQDYVQYLKALWNRQLPYSQEMLRVMSMPGRDRIFCGTEVPQGTLVYNKTGTTAHLCGDMGILVTKTKNGRRVPYAIVGIVERPSVAKDYRQWMVKGGNVIRDFSSLVYSEMKRKYNLL